MTDTQRTQAEGTALGAGLGAALGAGIGAAVGGKQGAALGALLGGLVGGGAGAAWGAHVASKKAQYANTEDYLDAVIQKAQLMNGQTQQYNASLASQIQQLNKETDNLVRLYRQKQVQKAILQEKYQETEQKFTEASKQLNAVNTEIQIQQRVLNNEKKAVESTQTQARLKSIEIEIQRLEQQRDELQQNTAAFGEIRTRLLKG
jgi:chromosome segregation ATPase